MVEVIEPSAFNSANDADVSNLCSRRLWEILQLSTLKNVTVEQDILLRIEQELEERQHQSLYEEADLAV